MQETQQYRQTKQVPLYGSRRLSLVERGGAGGAVCGGGPGGGVATVCVGGMPTVRHTRVRRRT